ncbi:hypothetical protein ACFL3C_00565 [Patescibacteria group bacterium]
MALSEDKTLDPPKGRDEVGLAAQTILKEAYGLTEKIRTSGDLHHMCRLQSLEQPITRTPEVISRADVTGIIFWARSLFRSFDRKGDDLERALTILEEVEIS